MEVGELMLVLITYDVSTSSKGGTKRLRKVAKACQNYGQRVQNSVFECIVDATQYTLLKIELEKLIDPKKDSLRFYNLGNNHKTKVEHFGVKESLDLEEPLLF
jgi:CRISPR-associated protein Cas2